MRGWGWGWLAAGVVLAASGCTVTAGGLGVQCERNAECQTPYVCRLAHCRVECATARDCPIGSLCVRDQDGLGACRLPEEATCATDDDCAGVLECLGNACTNGCGSAGDRECAPGAICDMASGCLDLAERSCVRNSDCELGGVSDMACAEDLRCRQVCFENRDCRPGQYCDADGLCMTVGGGMDAGMDGSTDGSVDGSTDGSMDGSTDGSMDGSTDGSADGSPDGSMDGSTDGAGGDGAVGPPCPDVGSCYRPVDGFGTCVGGYCRISSCVLGMMDCDGDYANGCEVNPTTDVNNCGGCGVACAAGEVCAGTCMTGSVAELDLGDSMSCARFTTGHVVCWGSNQHGQLGAGPDFTIGMTGASVRSIPTLVYGLTDAVDLVVGAYDDGSMFDDESHVCAVRSGGSVVCWGTADSGQIGMVSTLGQWSPVAVAGISDAVEVAAGAEFTCARRMGGTVVCWGQQLAGRLGNGLDTSAAVTTPTAVTGLTGATALHQTFGFFLCASTAAGYRCWGSASGALGAGAGVTSSSTPIAATELAGLTGLQGATRVNLGIDASGNVACVAAYSGSICGPTAGPVDTRYTYTDFTGALQVAPGFEFVMARRSSGEVRCWGENDRGQCGLGRTDSPITPPEAVPGITDVTEVAAGYRHSCIVRASGGVWCSGSNIRGQLGHNTMVASETSFVRVVGLP